ncbi:MAG: SH3 domain-containing protein [Acidobacteriia bacterium]|nr:SH3 domain-containing protein [Terriglobia bacterium]
MRKVLLGFLVVLVIGFGVYLRSRRPARSLGVAYVTNREVLVWSTTAQVRERVATLGFGERLEILDRLGDQVKVRTAAGVTGWTAQGDLLSADFWQKARDLEGKIATAPVEARGHTRVLTNLHTEPGRDAPRIRQLTRAVPVELFERRALDVPAAPAQPAPAAAAAAPSTDEEEGAPSLPAEAKKEDWWLVRAHLPGQATIAGWVLGRFVDLDAPAPLPDYASSAGVRIVAWFELNHVVDASGAAKPQYLVAATRGSEGQPCDFTVLRVYTWGLQGQRYETAFAQSNFCGKLPVKLTAATAAGGDATFSFEDWSRGAREQRSYQMHQTTVRRVRESGAVRARP